MLAWSAEAGPGMVRDGTTGDIFILNHLEYDADTLAAEYHRDAGQGLDTALPANYFPDDDRSPRRSITGALCLSADGKLDA